MPLLSTLAGGSAKSFGFLATVARAAAAATDQFFNNVVLLLDGDGTSGDDNNTFTDSSTNNFTVTESGSVVQGSFSPYGDNWSNYFDGSDRFITSGSSDFAFGTGDLSIDLWVNLETFTNAGLIGTQTNDTSASAGMWYLVFDGNTTLRFGRHGSPQYVDATVSASTNTWHHVHVSRVSSTVRIFFDGVSASLSNTGGGVDTYDFNSNGTSLTYGSVASGTTKYTSGYISNLRVIKGTSAENKTSNFTPPTSPLTAVTNTVLLLGQSNRFVDNSSSAHSFTVTGTPKVTPFSPFKNDDARDITTDGGSGYWHRDDLSYLTFSGGPSTVSDITISFWIYGEDFSQVSGSFYPRVFASGLYNGSPIGMLIYLRDDDVRIYFGGEVLQTPLNKFEWNYIVAQRSSGTWTLYKNGSSTGTSTTSGSTNINLNTTNYIGSEGAGGYHTGYLADFRITTSGSTSTAVPTSPVTAVTNTELLLNFQDAGIYDRTGLNNLDTVGNAQIDTAVKKYGTGSLKFDGSGDYLTAKVTPLVDFGSGDWTVESWINLSTINQFNNIVNFGRDTVSGISLDLNSSNQLRIIAMIGGSWTVVATGTTGLSADTWYHVAFVRNGSSFKIYLDGTEDGSGTNSGSITNPTSDASSAFQVGYWRILAGTDRYFSGYIDDLRITKGIARYTANFTPPTAELPKF